MQVCYIDESGDTGKFVPEVANSQPLFVLSGIVVDQQFLPEMTCSVIELKRKFFPNHGNLNTHWHDWLKSEVKGSYLRQMLWDGNRDQRRHMMMFMGKIVELLERHHCSILSRVYLKALQYRYDLDGRKMGGVRILSGVNRKVNPLDIFGEPPTGR